MSSSFVHLHLHSDYSLLDGMGKIKDYIGLAQSYGMDALALTDHGVMYGAIELYTSARKAGIKPIIGCEMYVAPRSMRDRAGRIDADSAHLLVLARDYQGYQNLMKLVSLAHLEGYYYKPRIDHDLLAQHSGGLIITSSCIGGEVPQLLLQGRDQEARERADLYRSIVGAENYFIEIQDHPFEEQQVANRKLIELARDLRIPLVATCDTHYPRREDAEIQDILLCVQTGKMVGDANRMRMASATNYLRPPEEMERAFAEVPEALSNTLHIASMCDVELPIGEWILPRYDVPEDYTPATYLRKLCEDGLRRRYETVAPQVQERLDYELNIIETKGYSTYMLIVQDFVNWAREQGIAVTSRGSAAGSLVSYLVNITSADPLEYRLPFERFLTVHRPSPPDIDMDFEDSRREEVIEYVTRKYGEDRVAQIITFGTMEARAAVRDVGRVLGISYSDCDAVAKMIQQGSSIAESLESASALREWHDRDPEIRRLLDVASKLEGVTRHASTHAAGVIISREPIMNYTPVQKEASGNKPLVQYDMRMCEEIGLLKMDFLGLANLSVLGRAVKTIRQTTGREIDLDTLPLDDVRTYELLSSGETTGVFQLESGGMRRYIKELRPTEIRDVAAMISLYRPGPMDMIPHYIRRKHGQEPVEYLVPQLESLLRDSYGVLVYQDDILLISIEIAGYTWEEADKLRKAVGKKIKAELEAQRDKFIKGCQSHGGLAREKAQELWDWLLPFARYGFNKCTSGRTYVWLADGSRMQISRAYELGVREVMSMWPDGVIRPHRVQRIVRTGTKDLVQVRTRSGRRIKVTPEHRLLTTEGYKPISEMTVGETELIVAPRRCTSNQREARRRTMTTRNQGAEQRSRVSARVRAYQESRPAHEKIDHMKRMHALYPDLTRNAVAAMHDQVKWLFANDPEWKRNLIAKSLANTRACYDTGPGFGRCSIASNGMWCASQAERDMCEWLIQQDIDFQMHKVLPNGRVCDFYFAGIYWEMDGMDREPAYFHEKYNDLPYVVVTPEDFRFVVERHLQVAHAENGDMVVSIEPCGGEMTYDIEMAPDGPLNYIANKVVSHNSHAAAYSLVAYQTAYLKANYPSEYM
ncbi:MAG: DNA polymerase III subunit alpha, partial [Chloroflexota bacterium]|nr:DNA polymerase III subunit alpha [Chloroflexota bacterium]